MFDWIIANAATLIVGAVLLFAVVLAVCAIRKRKKRGGGCAGGCGACPYAGDCHTHENDANGCEK